MKGLRKKLSLLGMVSAMGVAMAAQQAQAIPMLKLSDGVTTIEITDGDALDTAANAGMIGYTGVIGNFTLNVTTGLTKPAIGTEYRPLMDVLSFHSTSLASGTLTLTMTETDYVPLDGGMRNYSYRSSIGGVTLGTVTYQTYLDESNTPYEEAVLLGDMSATAGQSFAFALDEERKYRPGQNYSLTSVITVHHTAGGQNTSFNAELRGIPNPEPVTGALSLMGLGALTSAMRRRQIA